MPELAYLSLGSNVGDREGQLLDAIRRLGAVGRVQLVSPIYETEPVDFTAQPMFLNCVIALETSSRPAQLMQQLIAIEKAMGRERIQKKGPRTIDLDILLFGNEIVNTPDLMIPHPAMEKRRFVLQPLADIAPEARHPLLGKAVRELLEDLPLGQSIRRWKEASDQRLTTSDEQRLTEE
jgi:2-amino-4-hydroxy-6-hydroxymethyldihydropteridine diphosphokinase